MDSEDEILRELQDKPADEAEQARQSLLRAIALAFGDAVEADDAKPPCAVGRDATGIPNHSDYIRLAAAEWYHYVDSGPSAEMSPGYASEERCCCPPLDKEYLVSVGLPEQSVAEHFSDVEIVSGPTAMQLAGIYSWLTNDEPFCMAAVQHTPSYLKAFTSLSEFAGPPAPDSVEGVRRHLREQAAALRRMARERWPESPESFCLPTANAEVTDVQEGRPRQREWDDM